eukprot:TRINITY_DN63037_c0_g1_i1.p2 TRINITY_DN63037_c0_g1~~TRINITY_DN63037_c0_g1_i1.p2  ORF type:complete len:219 (-),score=43.43 TRINITY_DN63037_c0_g1_i1:32-688(-)
MSNNLFAEINKGGDITKGLNKVSDDQKTHKNPDLRGASVVPASATSGASSTTAKKPAVTATKPPKGPELQGNKWVIEYHVNNSNLVIEKTETKHSVVIYGCKNSQIQIKGKINNIFIDNCQKTGVVFEDAISSVDAVNCKSVEIQCTGFVPCWNVDKVDGAKLYWSEACRKSEVVSAKSSEMNIIIPSTEDVLELPIPEQFKTRLEGNKLVTESLVHE